MDNGDLISRAELMADIYEAQEFRPNEKVIKLDDVMDAPSYELSGVVHCRECKNLYSLTDCPLTYLDRLQGIITARDGNWFCADGERKEPNDAEIH